MANGPDWVHCRRSGDIECCPLNEAKRIGSGFWALAVAPKEGTDLMSAEGALRAYCRAFEARDIEAIVSLFGANGLYELPLLGQRLVGVAEIRLGLERVFSVAEACSIEISGVKSLPTVSIAEGRMRAKLHRDQDPVNIPLAIVVESREGMVSRLSTYLDARPHRLWSDGPIFAAAS